MGKLEHIVISLPEQNARRQSIVEVFDHQGIKFKFFDAINGNEIGNSILNNFPYHRPLSKGELGCYSSHICVIKEFLESENDYIVIYEDDVFLANNYIENLNSVIKFLDGAITFSGDIILLGYRNDYLSFWGKLKINNYLSLKKFCDYGWGAHGYLLTRLGAEKIVSNFANPMLPFDCVTGGYTSKYNIWKNKSLVVYATNERLIELNDFHSDVSTITDRISSDKRENGMRFLKFCVSIIKRVLPI